MQLRGMAHSPKAMQQITTRRWKWVGRGKKGIETKEEYKDNLKAAGQVAVSPNESDALCGCVEIARRLGLNLTGIMPGGGSSSLILKLIQEREMHTAIRELQKGTGLPSGQLHVIKRVGAHAGGKLHRT